MDDDLKVFNPTILLGDGINNDPRGSEPQKTSIDTGSEDEPLLPGE